MIATLTPYAHAAAAIAAAPALALIAHQALSFFANLRADFERMRRESEDEWADCTNHGGSFK